MGSPLSPVLANLFMEFFESELLTTLPFRPPFWARYVDDVIIFWPDGEDFQDFFTRLNELVPTIKFTTEWEQNDVLPFLDLKVHRLNSGFSFAIYRKPTHSNQYIHYFSCQPEHVKRGSVFSLLLRAYRVCDQVHRQKEINFVFQAFLKVGFPMHILNQVHSKVKRKFFVVEGTSVVNATSGSTGSEETHKPTISLPHNRFISQVIKPVFHANDFRVVNKANNTLKSTLVNNKPPRDTDIGLAPGVYRIPCKNCPSSYFGETGRGFNVRLGEHRSAVIRRDVNNAVYKHKVETMEKFGDPHQIDWEGSKLLHINHNWNHRLAVESSLIKSFDNFNGMKSTMGIDHFSAQMVLQSISKLHSLNF